MSLNNLLVLNGNCYFRIKIPLDLRHVFSRREFKRSLRTKSRRVARPMLKAWASRTERTFALMRSGMLTKEQIMALAEDFLRTSLDDQEEYRVMHGPQVHFDRERNGYFHAIPYEDFREETNRDLMGESSPYMDKIMEVFLQEKGLQLPEDSQEYKSLRRAIALAHLEAMKIDMKRDMGDYGDPYYRGKRERRDSPTPRTVIPQRTAKTDDSLKLSKLIEMYVEENIAQGSWTDKTAHEVKVNLGLFVELLGDVSVLSIDRLTMVDCLNKLKRLPARTKTLEKYQSKTIEEILAMKGNTPMSNSTVQKYMVRIGSVFKWASRHGYMDRNPAEGLAPKKDKRASEERAAFTPDDLTRLLTALKPYRGKGERPDRWLIPMIALFSGMRLNEICQLYREDIREVDGIWCFDINRKKDKRLKNDSAVRLVPIHPTLIKMGLLDYWRSLEHERLWPHLLNGPNGYSHMFSKWFGSFNHRHVCPRGSGKVFHSFRHNFTDTLKQAGVQEQMIAELVGHSRGSVTMERYGKTYRPKVLLEVLKKVSYEVDLKEF